MSWRAKLMRRLRERKVDLAPTCSALDALECSTERVAVQATMLRRATRCRAASELVDRFAVAPLERASAYLLAAFDPALDPMIPDDMQALLDDLQRA
jgi:hypothetical protein